MRKLLSFILLMLPLAAMAQSASPIMEYVDSTGATITSETSYDGAPISVNFYANPEEVGDYKAYYEWDIYCTYTNKDGSTLSTDTIKRFQENTTYNFEQSGSYTIQLFITFYNESDTIEYVQEETFSVFITQSLLTFPNAFTPNDVDDQNKVFKAKNQQSIVEFEAAIFTRSGRKIYEWKDPEGGWDGKDGNKDAPDGVYYLHVKAKGADRREYKINQTITLLRTYREDTGIISE